MEVRSLHAFGSSDETKTKILDTATELFALNGFEAVSMKDIAQGVGIKAASIYYYYEGKEALLSDILSRFEKNYRQYLSWLSAANKSATTLEEVMDNMFNREFLEMLDPAGCLGMSLVIREQHKNNIVRSLAFELFYEESIIVLKADFDKLVSNDIIPPADTATISMLLMCCVLMGNDIRLHEYKGFPMPFLQCSDFFKSIKIHLSNALSKRS